MQIKMLRITLVVFSFLILFFSSCIKDKTNDYKYILVTVNLKLDASINTHPAAGEFISYDLRDPDPGGDLGTHYANYSDYLGKFSVSGSQIRLYKGRRIECRASLYYYQNDPDIIGDPFDASILDWETAVQSATPENDGTASYTWNVFGDIVIRTKDYGTESGDYITTNVNASILAGKWTSEAHEDVTLLSGVQVKGKIYDDGGKVVDFTQTTDSEGVTSEQTAVFQLSKGEYLTFSGYLEANPEVYDTKVLSYSEANENGKIPENSTHKEYTWSVVLSLYVE